MDMTSVVKDVKTLKTMILRARYTAAKMANAEMLKLYFAIGAYVSSKTREGAWGTGAIDEISRCLSQELPGLRGFSAKNMRNMRQFFEGWAGSQIWQSLTAKLGDGQNASCQPVPGEIWQPLAAKLETAQLKFVSRRLTFRRNIKC